MFNDLLEEIEKRNFDEFAFADDLAINGKGMEKLEEAIKLC